MRTKEALHHLLEKHDPHLFYEFLKTFCSGRFDYYEDSTGIRAAVHYCPAESFTWDGLQEALEETEVISTHNKFVYYRISKSSINDLYRDYKRFLKLKAFI